MRRHSFFAVAALVVVAGPAAASTAAAESAMLRDASSACRKASDLRNAVIRGAPIGFSDASAATMLLVTGNWRPRHMKGAKATMLCLYDRRSKAAEVQEAKGWSAPAR